MKKRILNLFFFSPNNYFFPPYFLIRLLFGLFFFTSGYNKVFNINNHNIMLDTLIKANIPYPEFMSFFVSSCEMICGIMLAFGLLTRINAIIILIISFVALITVGIFNIPRNLDLITWYSWLLYLPESLYVLIAFLFVFQGSGIFGIDQLIFKIINRNKISD